MIYYLMEDDFFVEKSDILFIELLLAIVIFKIYK